MLTRTSNATIRRHSSRWIWTAAQTQEVLNKNEKVVDAVVREQGKGGLSIDVVPKAEGFFRGRGFAIVDQTLSADNIIEWLNENGFEGEKDLQSNQINFVTMDELEDGDHKRRVLRGLIRAVFNTCDSDDDGKINMSEFVKFSRENNLMDESESFEAFHKADDDEAWNYEEKMAYSLSYLEFKKLLTDTNLLTVLHGDGKFGVSEGLFNIISKMMFDKADKNGDGKICVEEVQETLRAYNVSNDVSVAKDAFNQADVDGDGSINREEFGLLLLSQGIVLKDKVGTGKKGDSESICVIL